MEAVVAEFTATTVINGRWLISPSSSPALTLEGIRKGSHTVVFVMDYMATGFKRRM